MAVKKTSIIQQGRGLGALLARQNVNKVSQDSQTLPLDSLMPNPDQPRKNFDETALLQLADSIKTQGLLQPLIVTPSLTENGKYIIVAGERRYRACRLLAMAEVAVRVIHGDEKTLSEISLIENIQREDLSPLEVAAGLRTLMDTYSLTQEETASRIGWSRSAIANKVRLLALPESIQALLNEGKITEGHAKVLLSLKKIEKLQEIANTCVQNEWSVSQLAKRVDHENTHRTTVLFQAPAPKTWVPEGAAAVKKGLGIGIKVNGNGQKNKVVLNGLTDDQVNRLLALMDREKSFLSEGRNFRDVALSHHT